MVMECQRPAVGNRPRMQAEPTLWFTVHGRKTHRVFGSRRQTNSLARPETAALRRTHGHPAYGGARVLGLTRIPCVYSRRVAERRPRVHDTADIACEFGHDGQTVAVGRGRPGEELISYVASAVAQFDPTMVESNEASASSPEQLYYAIFDLEGHVFGTAMIMLAALICDRKRDRRYAAQRSAQGFRRREALHGGFVQPRVSHNRVPWVSASWLKGCASLQLTPVAMRQTRGDDPTIRRNVRLNCESD